LKSTTTEIIIPEGDFFDQESIDNWEKLFFAIDTDQQIILSQYSSNIAQPSVIKNVFTKMFEMTGIQLDHEVMIEFICEPQSFWEFIEDADSLYRVRFELSAPNLFGASKKANTYMEEVKKRYNATDYKGELSNPQGKLKPDREEFENFRDYADSGGGNWSVTKGKNGKKSTLTSSEVFRHDRLDLTIKSPAELKIKVNNIRKIAIEKIKHFLKQNEDTNEHND
jgi:hypothetical protein